MGLDRAQEKNMKQEGGCRAQPLKDDIGQGHDINRLKSNGSKMTSQIQLNLDPQSVS